MSFIIKGQGKNIQTLYVVEIDGHQYLTPSRANATHFPELPHVLASVPVLNRDKPFKRPDLTYSWESVHDDYGFMFLPSTLGDLRPDDEELDPYGKGSGWSVLLALAVAFAFAFLYVVMMTNRPLPLIGI